MSRSPLCLRDRLLGDPLVAVGPAVRLDAASDRFIRRKLIFRKTQSRELGVQFGLIQLMDIAVRALSPGTNDPTTAGACIDRLADVLVVLGNRAMMPLTRRDKEGRLLLVGGRLTFERAVSIAFDEIRHYSAGSPAVVAHLSSALDHMMPLLPPGRRAPIERQLSLLDAAGPKRGAGPGAKGSTSTREKPRYRRHAQPPTRSRPAA